MGELASKGAAQVFYSLASAVVEVALDAGFVVNLHVFLADEFEGHSREQQVVADGLLLSQLYLQKFTHVVAYFKLEVLEGWFAQQVLLHVAANEFYDVLKCCVVQVGLFSLVRSN